MFDGFVVETQADGREALNHVRRFGPDLVLLDLMLPGIDGLGCAARSASPPSECR